VGSCILQQENRSVQTVFLWRSADSFKSSGAVKRNAACGETHYSTGDPTDVYVQA